MYKKEELKLKMAIVRSMIFLDDRTKNIKKSYKYALQKDLYDAYAELLRLCIYANRSHGSKKTYQNKMDTQLEIIRSFVDIAVDPHMRLISPRLHKMWSNELNQIGCLLGAWIKATK